MKVFFRDDDLGFETKLFQKLLDLFAQHQSKLNVSAIPKLCFDTLTEGTFSDYKSTLQIVTHGYAHVDRTVSGKRSEYDASRSIEEVEKELILGKSILEKLFPNLYFPAFVPPWNTLAEKFIPLLSKAGYLILSRSKATNQIPAVGIQSLDVSISLHSKQDKLQLPLPGLLEKIKTTPQPVGILLHHSMMDELDFYYLGNLLKAFKDENIIPYFFSELKL